MKKILLFIAIALTAIVTSCRNEDVEADEGQNECFYFEAEEPDVTLEMNLYLREEPESGVPKVALEYSLDKENWLPFVVAETKVTLAKTGDRVYIRAKGTNDAFSCWGAEEVMFYHHFVSDGLVSAGGNLMYLLDGSGSQNELDTARNECAFSYLFDSMQYLIDASKLTLPSKIMPKCCCFGMFLNCIMLYNAPKLLATEVGNNSCTYMFANCTKLRNAPTLPATKLERACYYSMFMKCTSLETAPALPARELATYCYGNMFQSCESLRSAPELPATVLAKYCYENMFNGCSELSGEVVLPATQLADSCYCEMFTYCAKLEGIKVGFTDWGTGSTVRWLTATNGSAEKVFTCPKELDVTVRDYSHVPANGWRIETK